MYVEDVDYNAEKFWFFLNFAEKSLGSKGLARLYKDIDPNLEQSYLTLNTTVLQDRLASTIGSGREIGNLEFLGEDGLIESPKFERVLRKLQAQGMSKSVVYSNYFENGTLAFARFLDRKGLNNAYVILQPDMPADTFAEVIRKYNEGLVKILLMHPEITEGISLKGTRQFHVLEPVSNLTVLNQVVARAVRYQSHAMLAPSERHVDVYMWKSVIASASLQTLKLKKANWFKRYSEMSDWSNFGQGISQIDKNYDRKRLSPDTQSYLRLESVNQNIENLKNIMKQQSIEKSDGTKKAQLQPTAALSDDQTAFELDPLMLPKTNFRVFWNLNQKLVRHDQSYALTNGFGFNFEVEIPLWEHLSSGFYIEDYWGQKLKEPVPDLIDPSGHWLRERGPRQNVLGFGGFLKTQQRLPPTFGNSALILRVPLGIEIVFGQSLIPLIKDQNDLDQFLRPGWRSVRTGFSSAKLGYGLTSGLSVGFEYYPMEFVGLYVDGGYRVSYQTFPITVSQENEIRHQNTFEGFRGYLIHGWNVSTGIKLTY